MAPARKIARPERAGGVCVATWSPRLVLVLVALGAVLLGQSSVLGRPGAKSRALQADSFVGAAAVVGGVEEGPAVDASAGTAAAAAATAAADAAVSTATSDSTTDVQAAADAATADAAPSAPANADVVDLTKYPPPASIIPDTSRLYGKCPLGCHSDQGWGKCESSGRCRCALGHGGPSCAFNVTCIQQGKDPYVGFKESPFFKKEVDLRGWSPPEIVYHWLLERADAVTVIEVGVWKGRSANYTAQWLKKRGAGMLVAVDTWTGAPEFWRGMLNDERDMEVTFGLPMIYYTFLSNMVHSGLEGVVAPLPLTSKLASVVLAQEGLLADMIHVDAAHEYGSCKEDIHTWWPFVRPGGILVGDDFNAGWPGVEKAVKEFSIVCELEYEIVGSVKWVIERPDPGKMKKGLPAFCYYGDNAHFDGYMGIWAKGAHGNPIVPGIL